jgi:alpha-D-ribose 1-methylphosphonate 5-triphosphate synthase subunit PhnG
MTVDKDQRAAIVADRQRWMSVLARASGSDIERGLSAACAIPDYEIVKAPETGTLMLEGRAGGSGQRFNVGEATVSRAVVRIANGQLGFSYCLGHDRRKALLAALADALLQDPSYRKGLEDALIAPLARRQAEARTMQSRKAAATKVNFFTLVRGDG